MASQNDDRKHNYDDSYYSDRERDREPMLHTREARSDKRNVGGVSSEKLTPILSLGFIVAIQLVGSVWWAATLDSRVEYVSEQIKTTISENYSDSQAQADKLNNQLQIDQLKADNSRIEDNLKTLRNKLDKLYDRVYSK